MGGESISGSGTKNKEYHHKIHPLLETLKIIVFCICGLCGHSFLIYILRRGNPCGCPFWIWMRATTRVAPTECGIDFWRPGEGIMVKGQKSKFKSQIRILFQMGAGGEAGDAFCEFGVAREVGIGLQNAFGRGSGFFHQKHIGKR